MVWSMTLESIDLLLLGNIIPNIALFANSARLSETSANFCMNSEFSISQLAVLTLAWPLRAAFTTIGAAIDKMSGFSYE